MTDITEILSFKHKSGKPEEMGRKEPDEIQGQLVRTTRYFPFSGERYFQAKVYGIIYRIRKELKHFLELLPRFPSQFRLFPKISEIDIVP